MLVVPVLLCSVAVVLVPLACPESSTSASLRKHKRHVTMVLSWHTAWHMAHGIGWLTGPQSLGSSLVRWLNGPTCCRAWCGQSSRTPPLSGQRHHITQAAHIPHQSQLSCHALSCVQTSVPVACTAVCRRGGCSPRARGEPGPPIDGSWREQPFSPRGPLRRGACCTAALPQQWPPTTLRSFRPCGACLIACGSPIPAFSPAPSPRSPLSAHLTTWWM